MPILKGLPPREMERIKPCQGCRYLTMVGDNGSCGYIFYRGERRPCKFGSGCTVKDVVGKHKRHDLTIKPRTIETKPQEPKKPRLRGTKWDTRRAEQLLDEGRPITEIAEEVGAHYDTVRKWFKRQGLTGAQNKPAAPYSGGRRAGFSWDRDRAQALYEEGWRIVDIAKLLDLPYSTVSSTFMRQKWQRKNNKIKNQKGATINGNLQTERAADVHGGAAGDGERQP